MSKPQKFMLYATVSLVTVCFILQIIAMYSSGIAADENLLALEYFSKFWIIGFPYLAISFITFVSSLILLFMVTRKKK